jgi:REP-associated tyrosine transposase
MSRQLRLHIPGALYHVTSRGNNKQCIFTDDTDHRRFLELLARVLGRFRVDCLAFCQPREGIRSRFSISGFE